MKLMAIYHIERGRKAKPSSVAPGTIFDATKEEVETLLAMRAAREPSKTELVLAGQAEVAVEEDDAPQSNSEREALEARAKELKVKFNSNISDEKLAERIKEAEDAAAKDEKPLV